MNQASRLEDVASAPAICLTPDMGLDEAVAFFLEKRIGGAPVVLAGRVLGVVSVVDLLYALTARRTSATNGRGERATANGGAVTAGPTSEFFTRFWPEQEAGLLELLRDDASDGSSRGGTVRDVMTGPLHSLPADTELSAAADYMLAHQIHRLLVIDDGMLVKVVTTADMVRAIGGVDR